MTGHLDDRDEEETFRRSLAHLLEGLPATDRVRKPVSGGGASGGAGR
ncbi:hypothetical protein ACN27G_27810 [Plantactinospora sp. WMMB334]